MPRNTLPLDNLDALHHAYIVEGNTEESHASLFSILKTHFGMVPGHADLFIFDTESMGVDNVTDIISANMRKPVAGGKKFIVTSFTTISHNAQNSLLKTLEEPQKNTHIFLLTQTASVFLPTVLSRVHVVGLENSTESSGRESVTSEASLLAATFLSSPIPRRLELVKEMIKDRDDERINDAFVERFVAELETKAYTHNADLKKTSYMAPFLVVDEYLRDQSSSKKLLLEYLALTL